MSLLSEESTFSARLLVTSFMPSVMFFVALAASVGCGLDLRSDRLRKRIGVKRNKRTVLGGEWGVVKVLALPRTVRTNMTSSC